MKHFITIVVIFSLVRVNAQTFEKVKDINLMGGSVASGFTEYSSELYFIVDDGTNGIELWKTDGTTSGTIMVKDINPSGNSGPEGLTVFDGKLFFTANDGVNGVEPWVSDGTESGTVMLKDINPGTDNSWPREYVEYSDKLFFTAMDRTGGLSLWSTDGTATGTVKIKEIQTTTSYVSKLKVYSDKIFISYGNDGVSGYELWVSDCTAAGTVLFKDINPGSANSNPHNFCEYAGKLYFVADDGTHDYEVWVTDGTTSGTIMLKDINSSGSSNPLYFKVFDGKLYFYAYENASSYGTWASDGTATGTALLTDKYPLHPAYPNPFLGYTEFDGKLYFPASDATTGYEPWMTDGTASGTSLLKDIRTGSSESFPLSFIVCLDKLYFTAKDDVSGFSMFVSDGTETGTSKIQPSGFTGIDPFSFYGTVIKVFDGSLYFSAKYDNNGYQLWKYTDTSLSTGTEHTINVDFSIYPNPANNTLTLKYSGEINNISLIDLNGRMLQQWEESTSVVDVSWLNAGMYFIKVETDKGLGIKPFIKK